MKVKSIPLVSIDHTNVPRKEFGPTEIPALADEIKEVGLIHPILVRAQGDGYRLIAGLRRLLAHKYLKAESIPAHIYEGEISISRLAQSEQEFRKALTLSEQYALMEEIMAEEAAAAAARQKDGKKITEKAKGKTAAIVAQKLGWSTTKLERIQAIVKAAQEDPAKYGKFARAMDEKGKYFCQYERLRDEMQAHQIAAQPTQHHAEEGKFVCGDCLPILKGMKDGSVDHIITDPPFGIGKVYGVLKSDNPKDGTKEEASTPEKYWEWFQPYVKEMWRVLRPGGLLAIVQSCSYRPYFAEWFKSYGYHHYNEFIFCKHNISYKKNNRNKWNGATGCPLVIATDPVVMLWKAGDRMLMPLNYSSRLNWLSTKVNDNVKDPVFRQYPYAKPITAMEEFIRRFCREGSLIVDPFCGVGTTCIAAERCGHRWMGIEESEKICQWASKRRAFWLEQAKLPDREAWPMSDADGLWTKLNDIFHFTVDAAASADNAKLPKFWDKQTDALKQDWSKETVWLNPPFSRIEEFLGKAKTATLTVAIVPATALTTRYFASVKSDWMAIPPTRVHFDPPTGVRKKVQHATHGYPFLIYGQPRKEQIAALEQMGMVCYRC